MSESEDSDSDGAVHTESRAKQDDSCMQASKKRLSSDCCSKFNNAVVKLIGASICILGAVAIWSTQAEKLQGATEQYPKYYFLTYWEHSFYSILYVAWKFWRIFSFGKYSCNKVGDGKLKWSFLRISVVSGGLALSTMCFGYLWYLSLPRTPVSANTAIYQSAAAFVFIISVPLLKERVTLVKVVCVLMSIGGVTLISLYSNSSCHNTQQAGNHTHSANTDNTSWLLDHTMSTSTCGNEESTPLGYIFLLASVITYALTKTLYKKFATVKGDPAALCNGVRMVGYFGVHSLLWMWPPLIILHYTGVEVFEWPSVDVLRLMVINAMMAVLFNALIFVSIALSSPLFAVVGTILAIPTSVIVDWLVQKYLLPWQAFIGIGLIVLGFGGFASSEFLHAWKEQKREAKLKDEQEEKLHRIPLISLNASHRESSPPQLDRESPPRREWRKMVIKYII